MAQQGYGQLGLIQDPATRQLLQAAFDQIRDLQTQLTALKAAAVQRASGVAAANARLTGVSDPRADTDAVNRRTLEREVAEQLAAFATQAP